MVSQIQIHKSQDNQEGKTLIIEKYDYGFRFYFDDPNERSWFVKQDPDNPKVYEIIEEEELIARDIWHDAYENNGVTNLCGYFIMFLMNPEEMVEMFFGEKIPIKEVVVEDYSEEHLNGFESCDMWDLVKPKDEE